MDGKETSANERTVDVKKQKKVGDETGAFPGYQNWSGCHCLHLWPNTRERLIKALSQCSFYTPDIKCSYLNCDGALFLSVLTVCVGSFVTRPDLNSSVRLESVCFSLVDLEKSVGGAAMRNLLQAIYSWEYTTRYNNSNNDRSYKSRVRSDPGREFHRCVTCQRDYCNVQWRVFT